MKRWSIIIAAGAFAGLVQPADAGADDGWLTVHEGTTTIDRDGRVTHLNSQGMVTGSGRIIRQGRRIGSLRTVELKGPAHLQVQLGKPVSLTVAADDNLLTYLTSKVENGTLRLDTRGSFRTRIAPRVFLTAPNIDAITTSGSGNLTIVGVSNPRLNLVARGSGNLVAAGRTKDLTITMQGSGNAYMQRMAADRLNIELLGTGRAWVKSNGAVRARSQGTGTVYVLGRPSSLDVDGSGPGKVVPVSGN